MKRKSNQSAVDSNKVIVLHATYSQQQIINPKLINNLPNKNVDTDNMDGMMDPVTNIDVVPIISNGNKFQHLVSQQRRTNFYEINCKGLKKYFYDILA